MEMQIFGRSQDLAMLHAIVNIRGKYQISSLYNLVWTFGRGNVKLDMQIEIIYVETLVEWEKEDKLFCMGVNSSEK
jgi:hypothetical protein